jgi:UDPglucose 6-dehydrogenase
LGTEQELDRAATNADAIVLATEWNEYKEINPAQLGQHVANKLLIEGRNSLNVAAWQAAGWRVIALGRNVEA